MNSRTSLMQATVPPQAIDAEQAIIGTLLQSPSAWDKIAELVSAQDFYRADHRQVMLAIETMTRMNQSCDVITVGVHLRQQRPDFNVDYLVDLANYLGSAANIEAYAEIVRQKSMLRSLIDASTESVRDAYASDESTQVVMARAEQRLLSVTDSRTKQSSLLDMHATMKQLFTTIHRRYEQKKSSCRHRNWFSRAGCHALGSTERRLDRYCGASIHGKDGAGAEHWAACRLQSACACDRLLDGDVQLATRHSLGICPGAHRRHAAAVRQSRRTPVAGAFRSHRRYGTGTAFH